MVGRLLVSLIIGAIGAYMTSFVLRYIGADLPDPLTTLIIFGVALAWTLVAFVRS